MRGHSYCNQWTESGFDIIILSIGLAQDLAQLNEGEDVDREVDREVEANQEADPETGRVITQCW